MDETKIDNFKYNYDFEIITNKNQNYKVTDIEADDDFNAELVVREFFRDEYPDEEIWKLSIINKESTYPHYPFEFSILIKALSGFIKVLSIDANNEIEAINVALEIFMQDYPMEAPVEIKIAERRVNE